MKSAFYAWRGPACVYVCKWTCIWSLPGHRLTLSLSRIFRWMKFPPTATSFNTASTYESDSTHYCYYLCLSYINIKNKLTSTSCYANIYMSMCFSLQGVLLSGQLFKKEYFRSYESNNLLLEKILSLHSVHQCMSQDKKVSWLRIR